jgi:hypothetical protein
MKVWITKYWETRGLYQVTVEHRGNSVRKDRVWTIPETRVLSQMLTLGVDAFVAKKHAQVVADKLRVKRIAALKRKIEKLEKLKL